MRGIGAIYRREINSYFTSPVAYVIITAFLFIAGFIFYNLLSYFALQCIQSVRYAQLYHTVPPPMNINSWVVTPFMQNLAFTFIIIIPLLTMRLFAEEKRQGTMEMLLTAPVSSWEIILGKFLAATTVFLVMLALTFIYQIMLIIYGKPDIPPVLGGYLGIFLFGLALIALGMFISSLTKNQIVAAFISIVLFLFLWIINWSSIFTTRTAIQDTLSYLSITEHLREFIKGVVDTKSLVFFLSLTFLGLFLTDKSLQIWRWKG